MIARQRFCMYSGPLEEPKEAGGNRERGSYCTSTQSKSKRNRALVRCGVTVRCSALWECVEVQWCCHGDKLSLGSRSKRMQISLPYLYSNLHCQGNETFDPRSVLESNSHPFMAVRPACKGSLFKKRRAARGFQAREEEEGRI